MTLNKPRPPFAARLVAARKAAGLTQQAIAEQLGIRLNVYAAYESGARRPDQIIARHRERIGEIAAALGVTVDELLGDD